MTAGGHSFEYELPDGTKGRCWAQWSIPRDGNRSVILSEDACNMEYVSRTPPVLYEASSGYLRPIIAIVAWQYREQQFRGGEPEIWYEHALTEAGHHTYYRLTFTQDWRTGSYGEAVRSPLAQSEVPHEHIFFIESWPKQA
jgi:hypothetical protein